MPGIRCRRPRSVCGAGPDLGWLTNFFLKALKDGKRSVAEVYEYMKPLVEDEARRLNVEQSPSISPAPAILRGKFFLAK